MISLRQIIIALTLILPLVHTPVSVAETEFEEEIEDTELGESMYKMNCALRKLSRQINDPALNPSSLELVQKLKTASQEAALQTPDQAAKRPAKERAQMVTEYRQEMQELITTIDDLETSIKAGKNDEAAKIVKHLRDLEEAGHQKFRPKKS